MASNRPRLCVLAFPRLAQLVAEAAQALDDQVELVIENRRFSDALAQAQALIERGAVDGFISAGANGALLRRQLDYPVALVQVSGFDIMAALVQAARLSKCSPPRIGLITFETVSSELGELSQWLRVDLQLARYDDAGHARSLVQRMQAEGVDVFIGPSLVSEAAEALGLPCVFLYTPEAARRALDEALAAARVRAVEQARRQQLADIISQLHDGVLAFDSTQRIWLANRAMSELLALPESELLQRPVAPLLPDLDIASVLKPGAPAARRRVFTLGTQRMIGNLIPLDEGGVRTGAVLTVQAASSVERAGRDLQRHARNQAARARHSLADLVGNSHPMQSLRALAARFATLDLSVLIEGESGTGKELIAQGIHQLSPRSKEAFVAINCAAMPETLLESELFGYEEGAFTGALRGGKAGLFETAHRGTVFLDEIGDMSAALQVRLLRVLQEREVLRVGGREPIPIDVRIIAATHRKLPEQIRAGHFRQDLFYRINGLALQVPPLRSRREDLPQLITHLAQRRTGTPLPTALRQQFLTACATYAWPGNVRELENMVERLQAVASDLSDEASDEVLRLLLPELFARSEEPLPSHDLASTRARNERAHLNAVLQACGGNLQAAAKQLGISRTTLWRKLRMPGEEPLCQITPQV
ncbi:propionate catabolism operon regulatory protein PrpR [Viridibacterium curvum]|uniref:Propionate catabolism operon regulatory protein PrpR n=1 Tax=Viridibacterium curvum TaxID=1101404 RepID=A0ABP9QZ57_9RHOO